MISKTAFIGTIGGSLGLFLGMSFLSLTHLVVDGLTNALVKKLLT